MIGSSKIGLRPIRGGGGGGGDADADADAYIAAHNTASGLTMADSQKNVIQGFVGRLKGALTTNGSNLWALLSASNSEVYPFAPVSNSATSISTITLDLIDPSVQATSVNFVSGDVDVLGVTASTTKYMILKRAPNNYPQNSVGVDVYSRTGLISNSTGMMIGAYNGNMTNGVFFSTQYMAANNSYQNSQFSGVGLFSVNRTGASSFDGLLNGAVMVTRIKASTASPSLPFWGFKANRDSAIDTAFGRANYFGQTALMASRCGFTASELTDWNEAIQYYTTNIYL